MFEDFNDQETERYEQIIDSIAKFINENKAGIHEKLLFLKEQGVPFKTILEALTLASERSSTGKKITFQLIPVDKIQKPQLKQKWWLN